MIEIEDKGIILARIIKTSDIERGLNFFSKENEYIQVGAWNYDEGKILQSHIHNSIERKINRTYEVLFVLEGRIKAKIFNLDKILIEDVEVCTGEILILLESGHGYEVLQDNTKVIEIKNGPYLGSEIDRYRI